MLKDEMQAGLNKQINEEFFSSYLYLSMASHFENVNLKGFANWMRIQADEERNHAFKIINYIQARNGRVLLTAIAAPKTEWESPLAAMQDAYNHECHISECINELSSLSMQLKDHASHAFLEWFVTEQVEEEQQADDVVQQLKLIDGSAAALYMLDRELAARTPAAAPDAENA